MSRIDLGFVFRNNEYGSMFALTHGFTLADMADGMTANVETNRLTVDIYDNHFYTAFTQAVLDKQLYLLIGDFSYNLKFDTLEISVVDNAVYVYVMLDPLSAELVGGIDFEASPN